MAATHIRCRCGHTLRQHSIGPDRGNEPALYPCDVCDCTDHVDNPGRGDAPAELARLLRLDR